MTSTRIVILANNIDEVGGAQRVAHVVADQLAGRGHSVDLVGISPVSPRHDFGGDPAVRRFTLMDQSWPAPQPDARLSTRLRPAMWSLIRRRSALKSAAVAALGAVLRDGPPGIVVTTQLWAMEHLAEVPHDEWAVIGQYHSSFEAAAAGRDLPRALELYADVDVVTVLTAADATQFRRAGLNNVTWLPNPLAFWPERTAEGSGLAPDGGVVTYLGRLSTEKGVGFLVDAWGLLAARYPEWSLRIVGSGPEDRSLRRQAAALSEGGDRIEFLPPVGDAEAELARADIFVLPSLTEGLPLALAEAQALGLPCIAADCSAGVRLLSRNGTAARLSPRGDSVALADGLAELMASAALRSELGRAARDAVAGYRADVVTDEWEQLISSVLR